MANRFFPGNGKHLTTKGAKMFTEYGTRPSMLKHIAPLFDNGILAFSVFHGEHYIKITDKGEIAMRGVAAALDRRSQDNKNKK